MYVRFVSRFVGVGVWRVYHIVQTLLVRKLHVVGKCGT